MFEVCAAGVELIAARAGSPDAESLRRGANERLASVHTPREAGGARGSFKPPLVEVCCEVRFALRVVDNIGRADS